MTNNPTQNIYIGTQPIRVLQNLIPYTFENANPNILKIINQLIENFKFDPGFEYYCNKFPITQKVNKKYQTPYVTCNNKIHYHETFLSYAWCISYSLIALYDIAYPFADRQYSEEEIERREKITYEVFRYGTSLINDFSEWNKEELPNPESYKMQDEKSIIRANYVFLYAICFILYHEFTHIESEHLIKLKAGQELIIEFEKEADEKAIEMLQAGATDKTRETVNIGILVGFCCVLHLQHQVSGNNTHPDTDDRIHNFLEQIETSSSDGIWGIAFSSYRLWEHQFFKHYVIPDNSKSLKESYYHIRQQVKDEKEKTDH